MSLAISPPHHSGRPTPPQRQLKSLTAARQGLVQASPSSLGKVPKDKMEVSSYHKEGLDDRSEDALRRASREELEEALKEEWDTSDELHGRLGREEDDHKALRLKYDELLKATAALQNRTEEAYQEQSRLEADIESNEEVMAHLRAQLKEAEQQVKLTQKRLIEQERIFEAERAALHAQQDHLQNRIKALTSSRAGRVIQSNPNEHLQEELATLSMSHATLLAQLNTLTSEMHELKAENIRLEEENQGWEFLVTKRTFNGQVRDGGGLLGKEGNGSNHVGSVEEEGMSQLDALDEEMDELHSDLEAQSPILEDDQGFVKRLDDFSTSPEQKHLAPPRRRRQVRKGTVKITKSGSGMDLAAEMDRAQDGSRKEVSVEAGQDEEALRVEVKQLKEANKALSLYCSKIIDRIIAQEGFEQILAVDYKTRRTGSRSASGASTSSRSRPGLQNVLDPVVRAVEGKQDKKARPTSMLVRALSSGGKTAESVTIPEPAKSDASKSEKRARRGFSLDFRSLAFGNSSPTPPDIATKTGLRPLTLSTRNSPNIPQRSNSVARKLAPHIEDDEDRRERSRLEATLKLMGVERPSPSPSAETEGGSNHWSSTRTSDVHRSPQPVVGADTTTTSTPLSRLTSALTGDQSFKSPIEEVLDPMTGTASPEKAEAVLKAYDEREAEQVRASAKGVAQTGFTSPSPGTIRRASSSKRVSDGSVGKKVVKSESISTLWSMGDGERSRPVSQEFVKDIS